MAVGKHKRVAREGTSVALASTLILFLLFGCRFKNGADKKTIKRIKQLSHHDWMYGIFLKRG